MLYVSLLLLLLFLSPEARTALALLAAFFEPLLAALGAIVNNDDWTTFSIHFIPLVAVLLGVSRELQLNITICSSASKDDSGERYK